jgi:8-oxo-dGTP pyrophosphatase MutT (NUDIX family)
MKKVSQAAQLVLIYKGTDPKLFGKILGVSRKYDHNDFGLIGGKREDYDLTLEECIIRECKEETGLDVSNIQLIHNGEWGGREQFTYIGEYSGEIFTREPHVVEWIEPQRLIDGTFGEFNKMILELLKIV